MNTDKQILKWLKTTAIPFTDISKKTNISRSTLYNWIEGKPIRKRNKDKFLNIYSKEIQITNTNIEIQGVTNMDAQYVIDLQKDKIIQQEKELLMYKDYVNKQPLHKMQFDKIVPDMSSTIYIRNLFNLKPLEMKITDLKGVEKIVDVLKIPNGKSYFCPNEWFRFKDHPSKKIISDDSNKRIEEIKRTLPSLFESVKFMVGLHYMTFPVTYLYNNNILQTQCSIILDWKSSPKRCFTKTEILDSVEGQYCN